MSDDTGILIFLGIGVLVLAAIVCFGIRSSRKKRVAEAPTWQTRVSWTGGQPVLESTDLELHDKRQEELFRQAHPAGRVVEAVPVPGPNGEGVPTDLRVSRVGRSLRAGWPKAKLGLSVYFEPWERAEFPVSFPVKGTNKAVIVDFDAEGVAARDAAGAVVWSSPWATLTFSNGPDIIIADGANKRVQFEYKDLPELEAILIKYGTLRQMHF